MSNELWEAIEELEYLASLESTEASAYWAALAAFARHVDDMPKALAKAVEKESLKTLKFINEAATVVQTERMVAQKVIHLKWNDE